MPVFIWLCSVGYFISTCTVIQNACMAVYACVQTLAYYIIHAGVLTSTPFDGEITSAPNGNTTSSPSDRENTCSTPSGGETSSTPSGGETTTTPSGGGTTNTLSSRETPSGGQTTTTPSNQEPTTTPSVSSVETTVGGEHPGRTPLPGTTGTSGMGDGNGAWHTTLIACMYEHFTGEEPLSFIPIVAAIGAAVVLILIGAVLVVVIIVLMRQAELLSISITLNFTVYSSKIKQTLMVTLVGTIS